MDREHRARIRILGFDELAALVEDIPPELERGLIPPIPPTALPAEGTIGIKRRAGSQ